MIVYHGSPDKIVTPTFGRGEERHDYAYPECYVNEIVETQGKLFELVADTPSVDFEDFIRRYMTGKTRNYLDCADAYLSNLIFKQIIHYDFTLNSARM